MKKKIITWITILGLFIVICATMFDLNERNKNNLKKIKVADTTLTSWTYLQKHLK